MARFALVGMMLESRKDTPVQILGNTWKAWWMGDGAWMVGKMIFPFSPVTLYEFPGSQRFTCWEDG